MEPNEHAAANAAGEVNSAIVASTSTNLAAVLPFLFIGGLLGLLFRELIFTLSAAILASMVVALTLVPALRESILPINLNTARGETIHGVVGIENDDLVRRILSRRVCGCLGVTRRVG